MAGMVPLCCPFTVIVLVAFGVLGPQASSAVVVALDNTVSGLDVQTLKFWASTQGLENNIVFILVDSQADWTVRRGSVKMTSPGVRFVALVARVSSFAFAFRFRRWWSSAFHQLTHYWQSFSDLVNKMLASEFFQSLI